MIARFTAASAASPVIRAGAPPIVYLNNHCTAQVDACLLRADGIPTYNPAVANPDYQMFETRNGSSFVRKTRFLFAGVVGLSSLVAWVSTVSAPGYFYGYQLIAPDIIAGCDHATNITTGDTVTFVSEDGNNTVVTRTIVGFASVPSVGGANSDIRLFRLNADVPESIKFLKVAPADFYSYYRSVEPFPAFYGLGRLPLFTVNQEFESQISLLTYNVFFGESSIARNSQIGCLGTNGPNSYANYGAPMVSGDSGWPVCLVIKGELVLYSHYFTAEIGTSWPYWISGINSTMAALGSAYTVTQYALSSFPVQP